MRGIAVVLMLTALALAGCSDGGGQEEVVVFSQDPVVVDSSQTADASDPDPPQAGTRGHIAGVVVDEAIHPIKGAEVSLPGLDLDRVTDRNGGFAFADLYPGPYLIQVNATGYRPAETVLTVKEDSFTRTKFVLTAIPPPEPYHDTRKFQGFSDMTTVDTPFLTVEQCGTCSWPVDLPRNGSGLVSVILEAVMDPYTGADGVGDNSFAYRIRDEECCSTIVSGTLGNPMRIEIPADMFFETGATRFWIEVSPQSFPAPELNKDFEVFVTLFYNAPPPDDWSIVQGTGS